MSRGSHISETNGRLLTAATEVFTEVGYRAATLREICRRAEANIAAVNYHFRDKEQLYAAVLDHAVASAGEGMTQITPPADDPPEQKLRHFIHKILDNMLGVDRPVQLLQLVAHEMVEPTPSLDQVVEKAARPINDILRTIVAELLGPAAETSCVRDCTASISGAVFHVSSFSGDHRAAGFPGRSRPGYDRESGRAHLSVFVGRDSGLRVGPGCRPGPERTPHAPRGGNALTTLRVG